MKMIYITSTFFLLFYIVAMIFKGWFTSTSYCQFTLQGFSFSRQFLRNLILTIPLTGGNLCDWIIRKSLCMSSMLGQFETTGLYMFVSGFEHSGHLLVFFEMSGSACGYFSIIPTNSQDYSSREVCLIRLSMPSLIFLSCCLSLKLDSSMDERMEGRLLCVYLND